MFWTLSLFALVCIVPSPRFAPCILALCLLDFVTLSLLVHVRIVPSPLDSIQCDALWVPRAACCCARARLLRRSPRWNRHSRKSRALHRLLRILGPTLRQVSNQPGFFSLRSYLQLYTRLVLVEQPISEPSTPYQDEEASAASKRPARRKLASGQNIAELWG